MSTLWKALIAMALALPMAAYVAGSFAASGADELPRPAPIVIRDAPVQTTGDQPVLSPDPGPARPPESPDDDSDGDDDEDHNDDDDDGIVVVNPEPQPLGDDDDDGRDNSRDDDSGDGDD